MKFKQVRQEVLDTCLKLAERGYLAGTGGNVALRVDENHFAVTPSATDYYAMSAADICVLRLSDKVQEEGESPASVEAGLHAAVLKARPDCRASFHTHQPIASAYTLLAQELKIEDPTYRDTLGSAVPCVAYAPSGTGLLAWYVGRAFRRGYQACLMRNHGVVCVGLDPREAMYRLATLESACAAFFQSRLTDTKTRINGSVRTLLTDTLGSVIKNETHEAQQ